MHTDAAQLDLDRALIRVLLYVLWGGILVLALLPSAEGRIWDDIAYSLTFNDTYYAQPEAPVLNKSFEYVAGRNLSVEGTGNAFTTNLTPALNMSNASVWFNTTSGRFAYIPQGRYFGGDTGITGTLNFTIECWMLSQSDNTTNTSQPLFGQRVSRDGFGLTYNTYSQGEFRWHWRLANQTYLNMTAGSYTSVNTSWLHVAVTGNDAGWVSLMVNGSNVSHTATSGQLKAADYTGGATSFYFGMDNVHYNPQMVLDECRIWNQTRTATNISSLMFTSWETNESGEPPDETNITVNVYDEDSDALIVGLNLTTEIRDSEFSDGFSFENGTFNVSQANNSRIVVTIGQLNESDYNRRGRVFFLNGSNASVTYRFYLVNTTNSPSFTLVKVTDESGIALPNITVRAERWFPDHGWLAVEDVVTGDDGTNYMSFNQNDVEYRFKFYRNQTFLKQYSEFKVGSGNYEFSIDVLTDPLTLLRRTGNYSYSLTMNNESGNVTFVFLDRTQQTVTGRLEVFRLTGQGETRVCVSATEHSDGILNCTVPNVTGQEYVVQYCTQPAANDSFLCGSDSFIMGSPQTLGQTGVFWVVVLLILSVAGFAFIGVYSVLAVSLVSVMASVAGMWTLGFPVGVSLFVVFLISVYLTRGESTP